MSRRPVLSEPQLQVYENHAMRVWCEAALLIVLAAARARADPPTRYPIELRIGIQAKAEAVRYNHEGWGGIGGPPGEPSITFAGKQAFEAYRSIAARLSFRRRPTR